MNPHDDARTSEELGLDFATWLLYRSVTGGNKINLGKALTFELFITGPMTLVADYGFATAISLQGDNPASSPEAARALNEGKHLAKATMKVIYQNQSHDFTFNALTFTCASLKLPPMPKGTPIDTLLLRLDAFERFEEFWGRVYEEFLSIRLVDKAWKAETGKIRKWIASLAEAFDHDNAVPAGYDSE
jgi:hypothetical protein